MTEPETISRPPMAYLRAFSIVHGLTPYTPARRCRDCASWTSYCTGRGKCWLGDECPVLSIDPCSPSLDADGWTDEDAGADCPKFTAR
jgi:hypothetical protein